MSNLTDFFGSGGSEVTTSIINWHNFGGGSSSIGIQPSGNFGGREVLSGALTANTPATVLSITGKGRVPLLNAYTKDATSRTVRLVVEVDGVTVFDATSATISTTNHGIFAAGYNPGANGAFIPAHPIVFSTSLIVKLASSLTETDKVAMSYIVYRN